MGYTHYWGLKNSTISQKNFNKVVKDLRKIEKYFSDNTIFSESGGTFYSDREIPTELFNGNGTNKGVYYSGYEINGKFECESFMFNGDNSEDYDHETMSLHSGDNDWQFCKTARKPYDLAVCLILLSLKYHARSTDITSDGDNEDWSHAFRLWDKIFSRSISFKFKEWVKDSKTLDGSLSVTKVIRINDELIKLF